MSDPFLGELRIIAFDYAPRGWAFCQGQIMSISQNTALFSLLGTTFGGNGSTTFALPDLRDYAPMHVDNTNGIPWGAKGGERTHTLLATELPSHNHTVSGRASATQGSPAGALWAASTKTTFAASPDVAMGNTALSSAGTNQPHENMPPYLVLNYAIALVGIFPSRN